MAETCKGCSADVNVSAQQIARMLKHLEDGEFERVPDDVYRTRLDACFACSSLQYGTTCSHCGCIVHIRAKLADRRCPKPGTPQW
ncbi:hypothetical protein GE107_04675 [Cohnella sp. CFH 77786]|uniref:DUF6171 family protein n=1 Tax=Cohnella sp. CFH 77786 TaxID=2662265 RepID=UPI001C60FB56|nr:DUF6171 family protein [Cohnella sp. CFH 77786]MBW5445355.1 hypothetical protein [Cohnella sp. CFH 77786]